MKKNEAIEVINRRSYLNTKLKEELNRVGSNQLDKYAHVKLKGRISACTFVLCISDRRRNYEKF